MSLRCEQCIERLTAFLDGELTAPAAEEVHEHLEACTTCFKRSEFEESFKRAIRRVAAPLPAPPGLETRIRRALDDADRRAERAVPARNGSPVRRQRALRWRGAVAVALVSVAATLVLVLGLDQVSSRTRPDDALVAPGFLHGELVCIDCLLARARTGRSGLLPHLSRPTPVSPDPTEHGPLQLRTSDGRTWQLHGIESMGLDHSLVGRPASLVGTVHPDLNVVRVAHVTLHGPEAPR